MAKLIYTCLSNDAIVKKGEWYADNIAGGAFLLSPNMGFVMDGGVIGLNTNMFTQWKNALGGISYEFNCYLQNDYVITTDYATIRDELTRFNAENTYHDLTDELAEKLVESVNDVHEWHARFPQGNIAMRTGYDYTLSGEVDCLQTNNPHDKLAETQTWNHSIVWSCFNNATTSSSHPLKLALLRIQADIAEGLIECSEELKNLLDETLQAGVITNKGVHWTVNIDGTNNPIVSLAWNAPQQAENIYEASVEIRASEQQMPASWKPNVNDCASADYLGRYNYINVPQKWSFNSLVKGGVSVPYAQGINDFLEKLVTRLNLVDCFLAFRMTYTNAGTLTNSVWCYAIIQNNGSVNSYGVASGQLSDGSSVSITQRNTDDVFADFSQYDETDDIDSTNYGVSALSLLTKSYVVGTSRLKQLGEFLWGDLFTKSILNVNENPIENIVSCKVFPFTINGGSDSDIILGNVNTGVQGNPIEENANFTINVGSFKIPKFYNNFLDIERTSVGIFLPMIGFQDLTPRLNELMDKTLNVTYYIDILTGVCKAMLTVNTIPVAEYGGQIGFDIPLTASNRSQVELAQITSIANAVPSLAQGNVFALGSLIPQKTSYQTAGSLSPTVNMMTTHDVFLIIERPQVQYPSNYNHVYGKPCNLTMTLNNLHGFTKCENVDVTGIPANDVEKEMIKNILEGGFYVD